MSQEDLKRRDYLRRKEPMTEGNWQSKIKVLTGLDWVSYQVVKDIVGEAVELSTCMELANDLGHWEEEDMMRRTEEEQKELENILDELDKKLFMKEKMKVKMSNQVQKGEKSPR